MIKDEKNNTNNLKYDPDEQGVAFSCNVKDFLNDLGHDFRYTVLA